MAENKTRFRDLNWICKIGIVGGIIQLTLFTLGFLYGLSAL